MQVEPTIYMEGKFVDKTTVTIKGEKTRYLFRDDSFVGEIRIAFQTGIDWWKTELTLDGAGNIYYRDKDMPSNWADSFGAEYSQQAVPGKHIYLNFTTGTGHLE